MDRLKHRVWYIEHNAYHKPNTENFITSNTAIQNDGTVIEVDSCPFQPDQDKVIVELCTGLKDKNGQLIFEGDVVKTTSEAFNSGGFPRYNIKLMTISILPYLVFKLFYILESFL